MTTPVENADFKLSSVSFSDDDQSFNVLVDKLVSSAPRLKDAYETIKQLSDLSETKKGEIPKIKKYFNRKISDLKKQKLRKLALDANHARSLSTVAKREAKLDEINDNYVEDLKDIKKIETLFRLQF